MGGRLQDRCALLTGAASGIGRESARRFAAEGCRVALADIDGAGAQRVADELGPRAIALQFDVASEPGWEAAMQSVLAAFGRLDIVCNIAGIGYTAGIEDVELGEWERMVAVNLTGVLLGCKHGVRTIRASGGRGAIVNVSSVGGLVGASDIAGYCATKGGVTTLTKSVALYCAERGLPIRAVSIHPTYVDSPMLDPVAAQFDSRETLLAGMRRQVPMGRLANTTDVANAILFAASDEAAMISGSALLVDGAQLAGLHSAHTTAKD
jgi:NAD(P)-dependent dehydrogenase (short-subunit alcohol dehydrogenase family)